MNDLALRRVVPGTSSEAISLRRAAVMGEQLSPQPTPAARYSAVSRHAIADAARSVLQPFASVPQRRQSTSEPHQREP